MTAAEILTSIEQRLEELQGEIAALQGARAGLALDGSGAGITKPAARRRGGPQATGRSRTPAGGRKDSPDPVARAAARPRRRAGGGRVPLSDARLEGLLAGSPGSSTVELAERAGAEAGAVLAVLRAMHSSGRVVRLGEGRSTRWRLSSEEEWIAARAAELAARARTPAG